MALKFELATATAYPRRGIVADFLQVYRANAYHTFLVDQLQVSLGDVQLNMHDRRSLLAKARKLVTAANIDPADVAVMAWSSLREQDGLLINEPVDVHVVTDAEPVTINVEPLTDPRVINLTTLLMPVKKAYGMNISALVYDTPLSERAASPITQAMLFPQNAGYIALRGTETLIPAAEWLAPVAQRR